MKAVRHLGENTAVILSGPEAGHSSLGDSKTEDRTNQQNVNFLLKKNITCFLFWFFGHEAYGIFAPQPVTEPALLALKGEVLTPGPPGKFPCVNSFRKQHGVEIEKGL